MKPRSLFYRVIYIAGDGPKISVVVGGANNKQHLLRIICEIHPDWFIQEVQRIKRPAYAVMWTGK